MVNTAVYDEMEDDSIELTSTGDSTEVEVVGSTDDISRPEHSPISCSLTISAGTVVTTTDDTCGIETEGTFSVRSNTWMEAEDFVLWRCLW